MSNPRARLRELFVAALAADVREQFGIDLAVLKAAQAKAKRGDALTDGEADTLARWRGYNGAARR